MYILIRRADGIYDVFLTLRSYRDHHVFSAEISQDYRRHNLKIFFERSKVELELESLFAMQKGSCEGLLTIYPDREIARQKLTDPYFQSCWRDTHKSIVLFMDEDQRFQYCKVESAAGELVIEDSFKPRSLGSNQG